MQYLFVLFLLFAQLAFIDKAKAQPSNFDDAALDQSAQLLMESIDYQFGPNGLVRIDITEDKLAWGIDTYSNVWRWDGLNWTYIDSGGQDIGAGGAYVYLVRTDESIWIWDGYQFVPFWWSGQIYLKRVDAGADGSLWGVDANGDVCFWNGLSWYYVGTEGRDISIDLDTGFDTVYLTRKSGKSFALNMETWEWEESNWARRSIATQTIEK